MFEKKIHLEGRGNLAHLVMNEIMGKIIESDSAENEYLPTEIELTQVFDVSRITIREALKGLEERGFVERQQGKGVKIINKSVEVATNSLHSMMLRNKANQYDLLEVRKTIELQTVRLAALRADTQDLLELKLALDGMNYLNSTKEEFIKNDLDFHILVARASKNQILESIMKALQPLLNNEITLTIEADFHPEINYRYHSNIYDKIIEQDSDGAEKCMKEHLDATEELLGIARMGNE